jgi:predicted PurR-regulated permease PerM
LVHDTQALSLALPATTTVVFEQFFGSSTAQIGVAIPAAVAAQALSDLGRDLLGAPAEPTAAARAALAFYANFFLSLVVLTYLLMDGERLVRSALNFVAPEQRLRVRLVAKQVDRAVLPYTWGLVLLTALTLAVVWLAFGALYGLPYALPAALVTTLLGLVPFIGPLAAAAFAALIALGHGSLELAVAVVVFYYLYRLIERQLIAPRLIDRATMPHPVVTIFAVLAGAALGGLFGALLALPLAASLKVLVVGWQAAAVERAEEATAQLNMDAR